MKYLEKFLLFTLPLVTTLGILLPKWANGILQFCYPGNVYQDSPWLMLSLLVFLFSYLSGLSYYYYHIHQFKKVYRTLLTLFFLGLIIVINHILADQLWLLSHLASQQQLETTFGVMETRYVTDEYATYAFILIISSIALFVASICAYRQKEKLSTLLSKSFFAIFLTVPFASLFIFYLIALLMVGKFYAPLPFTATLILNAAFSLYLLLGLGLACLLKQSGHVKHVWLILYTQRVLIVLICIMLIQAIPLYFFIKVFLYTRNSTAFSTHYLHFIVGLLPCIASVFLVRKVKRYISQSQFADKHPTENTRGVFGTAEFATKHYVTTKDFYNND